MDSPFNLLGHLWLLCSFVKYSFIIWDCRQKLPKLEPWNSTNSTKQISQYHPPNENRRMIECFFPFRIIHNLYVLSAALIIHHIATPRWFIACVSLLLFFFFYLPFAHRSQPYIRHESWKGDANLRLAHGCVSACVRVCGDLVKGYKILPAATTSNMLQSSPFVVLKGVI